MCITVWKPMLDAYLHHGMSYHIGTYGFILNYYILILWFIISILDEVSNYSKHCGTNSIVEKKFASKEVLIQEMRKRVSDFLVRWKGQQLTRLSSLQGSDGKKKGFFSNNIISFFLNNIISCVIFYV